MKDTEDMLLTRIFRKMMTDLKNGFWKAKNWNSYGQHCMTWKQCQFTLQITRIDQNWLYINSCTRGSRISSRLNGITLVERKTAAILQCIEDTINVNARMSAPSHPWGSKLISKAPPEREKTVKTTDLCFFLQIRFSVVWQSPCTWNKLRLLLFRF